MILRRAQEKDVPRIMDLLSQVLTIHANIRPDLFVPGTTKYTAEELCRMVQDDEAPIYAAADENDRLVGYAFCVIERPAPSNNMVPHTALYIDDLCVDAEARGQHVGQALLAHVKEEARRMGCYEITLNVWEGNDAALGFYRRMGFTPKKTCMEIIL